MSNSKKRYMNGTSKIGLAIGAGLLGAMVAFSAPAAADEISDLQAENDALRSQVEGLARDLQKVRDAVQQNQ